MKYIETIACRCRYGEVAERIFGDAEIIYEDSCDDWQGYARLLAHMPNGEFCYYEWFFGSCSGCDDWEFRKLDDTSIEKEMRSELAWLHTVKSARQFVVNTKMADAFEQWLRKPENQPINEGFSL